VSAGRRPGDLTAQVTLFAFGIDGTATPARRLDAAAIAP